MTRPPPLPLPVPFPVYGLDDTFTGARNLVLWSDWGYLWVVTLCFGDRPITDHIGTGHAVVETIRKQAKPQSDESECPSQPNGLKDAALHAVIRATSDEVRGRQAKAAQRALHVAEVHRIVFDDKSVTLRDWTTTSLMVDGRRVPAFRRDIGAVRAIVADLADVVVSVTFPLDFDPPVTEVIDLRHDLADYPWPSSVAPADPSNAVEVLVDGGQARWP